MSVKTLLKSVRRGTTEHGVFIFIVITFQSVSRQNVILRILVSERGHLPEGITEIG